MFSKSHIPYKSQKHSMKSNIFHIHSKQLDQWKIPRLYDKLLQIQWRFPLNTFARMLLVRFYNVGDSFLEISFFLHPHFISCHIIFSPPPKPMKPQRGRCWNKWRSNRDRTSIPTSCLQCYIFQWRQTSTQARVLLKK